MHMPSTDSLAASLGISTSCHAATGHLCTQWSGNTPSATKSSDANAGKHALPQAASAICHDAFEETLWPVVVVTYQLLEASVDRHW